ncbi:uncharacterized protein LOC125064299 [Vanessa atalanta]|uniref:uncharacterized protein LOC125064299 n=1 Tax=Vanessa atalanta TaxID=42275 RepID=UPI001FCDADC7|nr:uncharacterized protein LOC125064299 [Vanessa atalanta]
MQSNVSLKNGQTSISAEISKKVKNTRQNEAARKVKPTLIPMLKSSTRKVPTKETSNSAMKSVAKRPNFEHNNVQRVQRLNIDNDICPGIASPPKSVTTARPIPTLQHIYGQDLSNETFAEWLLETVSEYQDAPEHFADTTSEEAQRDVSDCRVSMNIANNELNNLSNSFINVPEVLTINPTGSFKSTNENVQDWLSTKLDCPTRDNESDILLGDKPTYVINQTKVNSSQFNKKKTWIPKLNTEIKLDTKQTDIQIPVKYPSYSIPLRNLENNGKKTSSYVDCPSEVLQKTTNFDTNVTDSNIDWSRLQRLRDYTINGKSSKTSILTNEPWQLSFCDDKDEPYSIKSPDKNSYHDYYYHYCWRKEVAKKSKAVQDLWDCKGRCRKCQGHRISPYQKKFLALGQGMCNLLSNYLHYCLKSF